MKFFTIFLLLFSVVFAGCQLQENYSMKYTFSISASTENEFTKLPSGFEVSVPLDSFGCDPTAHSAELKREKSTFSLYLTLADFEQTCDLTFQARVEGIERGDFTVEVYRASPEVSSPLLRQEFTIK